MKPMYASLFMLVIALAVQGQNLENRVASDRFGSEEAGIDRLIAQEQIARKAERIQYQAWFKEASEAYPSIPKGMLEAIALRASHWIHLNPTPETNHQHMPAAYGLMGFYDGVGGFRDTLSMAAQALGVSVEEVRNDPYTNIMAGAAFLARLIEDSGKTQPRAEELVEELVQFSGLPLLETKTGRFPLESYAYDVLLAMDQGYDQEDIQLEESAIEWLDAFQPEALVRMKAPFVRLDPERDLIEVPGYRINEIDQTLVPDGPKPREKATVDYPGALWVASPYNWTRSATVTDVTIHTTQGSYAGTISWFQNNPYSVSAHYVVRSSDGQITQMVREYLKAAHVGVHNSYTIGIEHEGYVSSSSWYTTAMYNASSALTRDICVGNGINPTTAYSGPASSGVVVLSTAYKIKGHQHYSSQTHTDPGIYWDWSRYYTLLNGSSGTKTVLDSFESSEGHFTLSPAYSGSTVGISTASTADRNSTVKKNGSWSEQIKLVDNTSSSSSWAVRFLSGSGSPSNNTAMTVSGGNIGFWVYCGGSGLSVGLAVDDSDGTERSTSISIPATTWTWVSWDLDNAAKWNAWYGGNGALTASTVTLDAIWLYRAQTSYDVYVYLDDVTYTR